MKKTVFSFIMLVMIFAASLVPPVQAQTAFTDKGSVDVSSGIAKCFNFAGTLKNTDTVYTYGFETIGLQPIFDFSYYTTYSNDSAKVNFNLQGYYSYTAQWANLKSLGTDSLRNVYYAKQDTFNFNPDSVRIQIWGGAAAVGSNIANGKQTIIKGTLKYLKKTY